MEGLNKTALNIAVKVYKMEKTGIDPLSELLDWILESYHIDIEALKKVANAK